MSTLLHDVNTISLEGIIISHADQNRGCKEA